MRDIQDSQIYVDLLRLLTNKKRVRLLTVRLLELLAEKEYITIRDFSEVTDTHYRTEFYAIMRQLRKVGLVEEDPRVPRPIDFEDWGNTRKKKWGSRNRGRKKYRLTLESALKAVDAKVLALTGFRERLVKLKEEKVR